jgi:hypothetical protein
VPSEHGLSTALCKDVINNLRPKTTTLAWYWSVTFDFVQNAVQVLRGEVTDQSTWNHRVTRDFVRESARAQASACSEKKQG